MARPAIVIGLGGTGQWVLTYVKKDLLEIYEDRVPPNVHLVAFDTNPQATAEAARAGREKEIKVGAVKLEPGTEFVHVGGDVFKLAQQIEKGQHPHLGSWFQAGYWLSTLSQGAFNLAAGSGQIRAFGRMAVFHDLSMPSNSQIWTHLTGAMKAMQHEVGDPQQGRSQLEIIIVGSLAGGTGAGMFIDMALLARAAAAATNLHHYIIRGFLALPRTFVVGSAGLAFREMRARAFAAWRELDRFMICDKEFGLRNMQYHATWSAFQPSIETAAFDICYLVDPLRSRVPLSNIPSEKGVFPSIAAAISAILDTTAGRQYTEYITTNVSPARARHPGTPLHSSIGTYTVKVPIYYAIKEFSASFALDILDALLKPVKAPDGRVTDISPMQNEEIGIGKIGRTEVLGFLECASLSRIEGEAREEVQNTLFTRQMADIIRRGGPGEAALVREYAGGGTKGRGGPIEKWLAPLTDLGETPEMQKMRQEIDSILKATVQAAVPPSDKFGDDPKDAIYRFQDRVPRFCNEHIGTQLPDGTFTGGKFAEALDKCTAIHLDRFRRLLRLWLLNTLMGGIGTAGDPIRARSGKLGYALDFCAGLVENLDLFLAFMGKVKDQRQEGKFVQEAENRRRKAWDTMKKLASKKILLLVTSPDAYEAQKRYLKAEQEIIDLRKEDIITDAVIGLAKRMRDYAAQARDALERWKTVLATGDAPTRTPGLYSILIADRDRVRESYRADQEIDTVQKMVGEMEYKPERGRLARALEAFRWSVSATAETVAVDCRIVLPQQVMEQQVEGAITVQQAAPTEIVLDLRADGAIREGRTALQNNLLALSQFTYDYFRDLPERQKVARVLAGPLDPDKLADELFAKGEPLWQPATGVGEGALLGSVNYIRVNRQFDPVISAKFERAREIMHKKDSTVSVELVESEDTHTLTCVRSDDMIRSQDFEAWHDCQRAYLEVVNEMIKDSKTGRPRRVSTLYMYPAEANAAEYEQQVMEVLGDKYPIFHPKVVMMLEDKAKARDFLLCLAYNLIRLVQEPDGSFAYVLQLPGAQEPIYLVQPTKEVEKLDIFRLMNTFVLLGHDQRPGRRLTINYAQVEQAINNAQQKVGDAQANINKLNGEIERLKRKPKTAADLLGGLRSSEKQELVDLGYVAELMFRETIAYFERLKGVEQAVQKPGPRTTAPGKRTTKQ